jgi:hypothetical protein
MKTVLNYLIYIFALFLRWSYRFEHVGREHIYKLKAQNKNFLLAIWHQNLLPGILAQQEDSFVVIVSRSKDAEPVAFTCQQLGHQVMRGSSKRNGVNKGGQEAKAQMIEWIKKGFPGAVTVDGPKGPALKVKPGIVDMALQTGAAIVPYSVKAKHYTEFNSWDKFQFAWPFSKVIIHYGEPIEVPEGEGSFDRGLVALEASLLKNREIAIELARNS